MSIYNEEVAQRQIDAIIESGAPIVKLNIFDSFNNYVPSDFVKNQIEYTLELYLDLTNKLSEYSKEEQSIFLKTLKDADIIDNHSIEKEDSFLITLHRNFDRTTAIDLLLETYCHDKNISYEEFINIHDQLLQGTSSEEKLGLRCNDLKFVGYYTDNPQTKFRYENRAICYFPLKHSEIDIAIKKLLSFINSDKSDNKYKKILMPMACHGLIAALQLFKDGNTRYGRLIQNIIMFQLLNDEFNLNLSLPIVYATRQYAPFRDDYRGLVQGIVVNNDNQAWEDWFKFNLKRIQDGIYYNMNCLDSLQSSIKKARK